VNSTEQVFKLLQQGESTLLPICYIFTGLEYFLTMCYLYLSNSVFEHLLKETFTNIFCE
jgi:hypothetical protein